MSEISKNYLEQCERELDRLDNEELEEEEFVCDLCLTPMSEDDYDRNNGFCIDCARDLEGDFDGIY